MASSRDDSENWSSWRREQEDFQNETREAWDELKTRLRVGDTVTGMVVQCFVFGVFIDFGEQFPALLEITQLSEDRNVVLPVVGEQVTGRVVQFADRNRQVRLTKRPIPWLPPATDL